MTLNVTHNATTPTFSQGWVKMEPGQSLNNGNVHVYMSGGNAVAICPTQARHGGVSLLSLHHRKITQAVSRRFSTAQL